MNDINKAVTLIHKLLALARDGGATESEAERAMAKAQELMAEHNLSMATLEAKGGAKEGRVRNQESENLLYAWKRELLERIAKVNFCHIAIIYKTNRANQQIGGGYEVIGRESNVAAVRNMFDYLLQTVERLVVDEFGLSPQDRYSKSAHSFRTGCCDRLKERLQQRFDDAIEEQSRKAREANVAAKHPAAATGNALVVVMEDFKQAEDDLNNDFINSFEPGTTAQRRAEYQAEQDARDHERQTKLKEILAADPEMDGDLAWYMACGWTRDRAEQVLCLGKYAVEEKPTRPLTEKQRQDREAKDRRAQQREQEKRWRRDAKTDWTAYNKGSARADSVGFDEQVNKDDRNKIK